MTNVCMADIPDPPEIKEPKTLRVADRTRDSLAAQRRSTAARSQDFSQLLSGTVRTGPLGVTSTGADLSPTLG